MLNSAQKTSKMITLTEAVSNYQNSMVETDSNKKRQSVISNKSTIQTKYVIPKTNRTLEKVQSEDTDNDETLPLIVEIQDFSPIQAFETDKIKKEAATAKDTQKEQKQYKNLFSNFKNDEQPKPKVESVAPKLENLLKQQNERLQSLGKNT